ncbi:MAG: hypothetical protein R3C11_08850 [Planctomycetaceae bacterium]
MATSRHLRMTLHNWDDYTVLDLVDVEIWDGADLALLRDTQSDLVLNKKCRLMGVNMQHVKYIPSGFFGMLYDWHEYGVKIRLYNPQPHVAEMLWFRQFFKQIAENTYVLQGKPKYDLVPQDSNDWTAEAEWLEAETISKN